MALTDDSRPFHTNVEVHGLEYPEGVAFAEDLTLDLTDTRIATSRYTSEEFLHREDERVWARVWQMACRVEDVPEPGDFAEYTIGDRSFLVVRGGDGQLRAFHNVCLHRGTALKSGCGHTGQLRCRYHGWTWALDGTLAAIPDRHLCLGVDDEDYGLRQAACDTWAGFVFIHPDPDSAPPLRSFLGAVPDQLAPYHLERMRATTNVTVRLACNWKVGLEAFLEAYHVPRTHPQLMPRLDDVNTAFELLGDHSRMIVPYGVPSMRLDDIEPVHTFRAFAERGTTRVVGDGNGETAHTPPAPALPPELFDEDGRLVGDCSVRQYLIRQARHRGEAMGHDYGGLADAQMIDDWHYFIFPGLVFNTHAGGFYLFRIRPARDPDACWFDLFLFRWPDENSPQAPEPVPHQVVELDQVSFGKVLDQDFANLPRVQRGLRTGALDHVTLTLSEVRIVHLHRVLDRYLYGKEDVD